MQDAKMVTATRLLKADTAGYMFCFCFLLYLFLTIPSELLFFQCFDTVGWASGRASGL